jgi:hypothetical protein
MQLKFKYMSKYNGSRKISAGKLQTLWVEYLSTERCSATVKLTTFTHMCSSYIQSDVWIENNIQPCLISLCYGGNPTTKQWKTGRHALLKRPPEEAPNGPNHLIPQKKILGGDPVVLSQIHRLFHSSPSPSRHKTNSLETRAVKKQCCIYIYFVYLLLLTAQAGI